MNEEEVTVKTEPKIVVRKSHMGLIFLMILLLAAAGAGAYMWRDMQAKKKDKDNAATISALQAQIVTLQKDTKTPAATVKTTASTDTSTAPNAAAIQSIKESITSDNTAALEGYMASTVKVIVAASEGIGDRTPVQAIDDLKYLDSATDPWNFSLNATTLSKYQTGDYKDYFKTNSVVGKSANNYVISFNFDSAGKINGIFMSISADLL